MPPLSKEKDGLDTEIGIRGQGIYTMRQLADDAAGKLGITKTDSRAIVTCMFELIKREISEGKEIEIDRFGRFVMVSQRSTITKVFKHKEKLGQSIFFRVLRFYPAEAFKRVCYTSKRYKKFRDRKTFSDHQTQKEKADGKN